MDSQSVVLCDAAESQPSDGTMNNIVAKNLNVPEGLDGVTVTAYLDSRTAGGAWNMGVTNVAVSSGSATLTTPWRRPKFFRIRVGLTAAPAAE